MAPEQPSICAITNSELIRLLAFVDHSGNNMGEGIQSATLAYKTYNKKPTILYQSTMNRNEIFNVEHKLS